MLYTPLYNRYDPDAAPAAVRFQTHGMIDEIALLSGKQKSVTHLFACGDGKLWCFPADKQKDLGEPVLLCQSAKLTEVRNLYAYEAGNGSAYPVTMKTGTCFSAPARKKTGSSRRHGAVYLHWIKESHMQIVSGIKKQKAIPI